MIINVVSEVANFKTVWGGMYSAFINHVEILRNFGINVLINGSSRDSDITHIHSYGPYALFQMIKAKRSVVSAHVLPETLIGSYKGGKYYSNLSRAYLRFFYNKADVVIALNPYVKKKLEEMGVKTKIVILSNVLDTHKFRKDKTLRVQGRQEYGLKDTDFVILGSGQFTPRKGVEDFIKVAKALPEYKFIWVGGLIIKGLSEETKEIKELLKKKPENLILTDNMPYNKMPMYYNLADVFFMPSKQDIVPMVIIEAAACGLPVIVRNLPGYNDSFKDSYISSDTNEGFVRQIKSFYEDKKFYDTMAKKSVELAENFSANNVGTKLLSMYKNLL